MKENWATRRSQDRLDEVLTVEEARARLRISRNGIYNAIVRGEIPHIKIGKRILIPSAAFEALLRGETIQKDAA
jgi:excisionase family DNA binding protein